MREEYCQYSARRPDFAARTMALRLLFLRPLSHGQRGSGLAADRRPAGQGRGKSNPCDVRQLCGEGWRSSLQYLPGAGPNGEILAKYRKIHLFGCQSREKQLLTPVLPPDFEKNNEGLSCRKNSTYSIERSRISDDKLPRKRYQLEET